MSDSAFRSLSQANCLSVEYAAAFFMLAGQAKDATNVVLRHLDDWQLAFALARAVEGSLDGPIVKSILNDLVLPRAFQGGHRWLASWGFWVLGRRDLAVRVLIVSVILVHTSRCLTLCSLP